MSQQTQHQQNTQNAQNGDSNQRRNYGMNGTLSAIHSFTSKAGNPYAVLIVKRPNDRPTIPCYVKGKKYHEFMQTGIQVGQPIRVLGFFEGDFPIRTQEFGTLNVQAFQTMWTGVPRTQNQDESGNAAHGSATPATTEAPAETASAPALDDSIF